MPNDLCDLCAEHSQVHPDDYVRVLVVDEGHSRPAHLCSGCMKRVQRCYLCRWYDEHLKKCFEGPFSVSHKSKDGCGHWKQDELLQVKKNPRGDAKHGHPKFEFA